METSEGHETESWYAVVIQLADVKLGFSILAFQLAVVMQL